MRQVVFSDGHMPIVSDPEHCTLPLECWHSHLLLQLLLLTFSWLSTYFWIHIWRELNTFETFHATSFDGWLLNTSCPQILRKNDLLQILFKHPSWLLLPSKQMPLQSFSTSCPFQSLILREHELLGPCWLSGAIIPKYPFTSAKITEYFVRE